MSNKFPKIQPGGSLILAWQSQGKRVLIVGGGEVAAGRIVHCLDGDAIVTIVAPKAGLHPEVAYRIAHKQVSYIDRTFEPSDLDHVDMLLVAIDDPEASTAIWKLAKERKIPVNIADVPPECDFYFGSTYRNGPLQIMVSTNGRGPRMASTLRKTITADLPPYIGDAIDNVGRLRAKLRLVAPGKTKEWIDKRMKWMTQVSDRYSIDEMHLLTSEDMDNLLLFFPQDRVPSMMALQALRKNADLSQLDMFDGSFGFHVGV